MRWSVLKFCHADAVGDRGMTERAVVGVVLTVLVVLIAWFVIVPVLGVQAVECTNNHRPDGRAPAMQVEVTTDRKGRIIERSIGECTFFSYKGPAWNTD